MRATSLLGLMVATLLLLLAGCLGETPAEVHNSAGVSLGNQGEWEAALAEYDQAIRLDPGLALAYYNRGQAYHQLEQYESAIQDYAVAITLHPEPAVIYTKRGEAYFGLGDYERATQDHDEAIRRDPMNALAFYNRGGAYLELGRRDLAIQDYREAVKLDRRFTVGSGFRCQLLYDDMDQFQPATKDCKSLTRLDRQYAQAFADRGAEFYQHGQIKRAILDFDEAIRVDASPQVYNQRGLAHQKAGKLDKAFDDFQQAIRSPEFAEPYINRGRMYFDLGKYKFAIDDYNQGIGRDASNASGYAMRALAYIALKRDKEAQRDIDRAVELGADRVELETAVQELKKRR